MATSVPIIDLDEWDGFVRQEVNGASGRLSVRVGGADSGAPVLLNHSILTSSAIWRRQATLLADGGYRVVCLDTRGHGRSAAPPAPYSMGDLVADNIAVLNAFDIAKVHFVGVSQGGMTGLGLGINHQDRLQSLLVIAARADAPPAFAAAWDDRIRLVREHGVSALSGITVERWFGPQFMAEYRDRAESLQACIEETSVEGFVGCAQAIQGLDYLGAVADIGVKTTLAIGSQDTALVQPMTDIEPLIANSRLQIITGAGHLPQIDHPRELDEILINHLR